ncbi:hypothetical protein ABZT02_34115 [Streptomyces sp. NPDC005402]|uniref:hypothetical protein n=1 Tax=Streptomyces sp. NPDC005402 TaxID=3155338 RepID=UPI0033A121AD
MAIASSRRIIRDTMQAVDDLPGFNAIQRRELRKDVRRIICRPRVATMHLTQLWMPAYYLVTCISFFGILAGTLAWTKEAAVRPASIGFAIGVSAMAVTMLISRTLNGRYRRIRLLRNYLNSSFLLYLFSALSYSALQASWAAATAMVATFPMSLFVGIYSYSAIIALTVRRRMGRTGNIYRIAARSMLETAALISRSRTRWDSPQISRKAVASIEDLARACQNSLTLRPRIGFWHADVFSQTATEALKVAHLVREHKKPIVCASMEEDFERVATSLSHGFIALLNNDRSKLLENAPEAIRKDRLKIALRHLLPVALFTAAAIALPMIPPISDQEKIAESLRLTFIVAAILSLVAPRSDSSTRILDTLEKSIPSK